MQDDVFSDLVKLPGLVSGGGRDRFVRNVLIAIGNSKDASLAPDAESLLHDPSPIVRAMAVWALGRLGAAKSLAHLAVAEADVAVSEEWSRAMAVQ